MSTLQITGFATGRVLPVRHPGAAAKAGPVAEARTSLFIGGDRFADALEAGITGVVMMAAFLFAAGLLHFGAPACALRSLGVAGFYGLAALAGVWMVAGISRAVIVKAP